MRMVRADLVRRWWRGAYDNFHDPIPLVKLPVDILSAFFEFFDVIVAQLSEQATTEADRCEIADLYVVAVLFIGQIERRGVTYQLERACDPGWRPAC